MKECECYLLVSDADFCGILWKNASAISCILALNLDMYKKMSVKVHNFLLINPSVSVQGDNTVDKGLISVSSALLSFRVRPVRVNQVP